MGNFTEKVQSVKKILNLWSYRDLTYIGKVTVIKTLALPILVQCLTDLPNPPDSILNDIQEIFYKFLWNGKKDKIKRSVNSVIINEYEGGLKMTHIQSFYKALRERPFNLSYVFFFKNIFWFCWRKKKIIWFRVFVIKSNVKFWKKISRFARQKNKIF